MDSANFACRWIRITVAIFLPAVACPAALAAEPETLETVLAVWRKREAAAKSVKVVISEVRTDSHATGLEGEAIGGTTKVQRTVILEGTNFRDEQEGEFTDRGSDVPQQLLRIATNNGEESKNVANVTRDGKFIRSTGWVHLPDSRNYIRRLNTYSVVRHWRVLTPGNEFLNLDSLKLVSTEEKLGGVRCVLLQQSLGAVGVIEKLWVAPEQEMAIVRSVKMRGEKLLSQLDTNFKFDAKIGWIPASWAMEGYKQDGSILATCKSSVVATELNPVVPKETFDIDWPPGTTVYSFLTRPATKFVVPRKK